jgi:hypothetical protein
VTPFDLYATFATALCGFYLAGRWLDLRRRVADRNARETEREKQTAALLARAVENLDSADRHLSDARVEREAARRDRAAQLDALRLVRLQVELAATPTRAAVLAALGSAYARPGVTDRVVDPALCAAMADAVVALLGGQPAVTAVATEKAARVIHL